MYTMGNSVKAEMAQWQFDRGDGCINGFARKQILTLWNSNEETVKNIKLLAVFLRFKRRITSNLSL